MFSRSILFLKKSVLILASTGVAFSAQAATPTGGDKIPSFMQNGMNKQARTAQGRGCPEGQFLRRRILWSPASGIPPTPGGEVPSGLSGRAFGEIGLNKVFSHVFDTLPLTKDCCRVKEAWLWMNTSHKDPQNPWTGNTYSGNGPNTSGTDIFATFNPALSSTNSNAQHTPFARYPDRPFSVNPQASLPSWGWNNVHLTNAHFQDRWLSYAMADDTNVRRTALVAKTCCLNPIGRGEGVAGRKKSQATANKFLQMMKKDKGRSRTPQQAFPRGFDPRTVMPRGTQ